MTRLLNVLVFLLAPSFLSGCGDTKPTTPASQAWKESLEDLGRYLKSAAADGVKPPAKMADLDPIEPAIPMAGTAIRNGDVVYLWGSGYVAGGNKVVAHEKNAATEGGSVLLQDGTVVKMTSAEFQAAPKAK